MCRVVLYLMIFAGSFCQLALAVRAAEGKSPNVLFIGVDDLRPEIRSYGVSNMITPNLDRLARRGAYGSIGPTATSQSAARPERV